IVTGAAFGNGRGIAERFAADGADVVIADIDERRAAETARLVTARGRAALVQRCDVARKPDVDALIAAAVARFGRIDVAVAKAGGRHGITCNAIAPGLIETGMTERVRAVPALLHGFVDRTPVGRIGQPHDVASVAAFLASDEASFVSGTMIVTDGGITAG